jgi:hypothetical protein
MATYPESRLFGHVDDRAAKRAQWYSWTLARFLGAGKSRNTDDDEQLGYGYQRSETLRRPPRLCLEETTPSRQNWGAIEPKGQRKLPERVDNISVI